MTDTELASIESRAGVRLPLRYRDVVLNYPQALLDMAQVYPGPKGSVQRVGPENAELYAHAELLEVANLADVDHRLSLFPAHYFIIGDSGCGDYYAIDTLSDTAPVYMSGPHSGEYDEESGATLIAESIEHWVEQIADGEAP